MENVALALKRSILPCLLDFTPLPPSLRAFHANSERDPVRLAAHISEALDSVATAMDESATQPVIDRLAAITDYEPQRVLQEVKTVFAQRGWIVQGAPPVGAQQGDCAHDFRFFALD